MPPRQILDPTIDEVDEVAKPTFARRALSRRTVVSLVVTAIVLAVAIWKAPIDWSRTWGDIRTANPLLYLAAIGTYYLSFLVRAVRWRLLLRNTGVDVPTAPLLEIILASFFVNCVVPAKLGDLYRAVQLNTRHRVGGGRSLGTIIAERLLDLFVLMSLLVLAGALTFHDRIPQQLIPYFLAGLGLCVIGLTALGILTSGRGQRLLRAFPETVLRRYEDFRSGTVDAFGRWTEVIPLTVVVWLLEAARLALVVTALGFGSAVGFGNFLLVPLVAALLTTVPFLPGGLGLVEAGIVAVLAQTSSLGSDDAVSIALLDRSISYATIVLIGGIVFLVFHARSGRHSASRGTGAARATAEGEA